MIKIREDIKKIQLFINGLQDEAHYIERVGSQFAYSYVNASGNGSIHKIETVEELEQFIKDLYKGYLEYCEIIGTTITLNLEEDLEKIKLSLNV
jgi:hypothetical protein